MGSAATMRPAWSITTARPPSSSWGGGLPVGWLAADPAVLGCGLDRDDMAWPGLWSWHRVHKVATQSLAVDKHLG